MRLTLLPALQKQRELLDIPRGMGRFREYLAAMTGGTRDVVLPIMAMNPMGREHVAKALDDLIDIRAEDMAASAAAEAAERLVGVEGSLRVALVVADDLHGGWTDRHLNEAQNRFELSSSVKRGFATVLLWSSHPATCEQVRVETLASIYRHAWTLRKGQPRTLREVLAQEGNASAFAGEALPPAPEARGVLERLLDASDYPTLFACMYGDATARKVGHKALGLPERAGFRVAREDATNPEIAIRS